MKQLVGLAACVLVVLVAGWVWWAANGPFPRSTYADPLLDPKPIVVTPELRRGSADPSAAPEPTVAERDPRTSRVDPSPVGPSAPASSPMAVAPSLPPPSADLDFLPPQRTDRVFDLDGNGRVGDDEKERAGELLERANTFAQNRSTDGSYPILKSAFRGEGKWFRAMDTNADGALTEREFLAFEADSIRQLRRFDQNADGALTVAEFGHLESRFTYLDEEGDGQLYAWEITLARGRGKW